MKLFQLHHQFKDHTEMCAQRGISSLDEMQFFINDTKVSHPLPKDAIWMACNEQSEHFVMTRAKQD